MAAQAPPLPKLRRDTIENGPSTQRGSRGWRAKTPIKPYEFDAELDLKATTALSKSPVRLEEMDQRHPQACGEMRAAAVKPAEVRASL